MKLIFNRFEDKITKDMFDGIAKALNYSEHQVGIISEPNKILDIFYENKPSIFVYSGELKAEEKMGCDRHSVIPVKAEDLFEYGYFADIFLYRPVARVPEFHADYVCINEYEKLNSIGAFLDEAFKPQFKLFQEDIVSCKNYCGWLPKEYHSMILSSAETVICNHPFSLLNHSIVNTDCVDTNSKSGPSRDYILSNSTCFHGAAKLLTLADIDINLGKYLNKYLETL